MALTGGHVAGSGDHVGDHNLIDAALAARAVSVKDPGFAAVGDGANDDTAEIQAAVNSLGTTGGVVFFPAGQYKVSAPIVVPGGVLLLGTSMDYSTTADKPARGSVIFTTAAIASVVQLGSDNTSSAAGQTGASMERLIVDGGGTATSAVRTAGRRNYIKWCQVWRGATNAVLMDGQNGYVLDSVVGNNNVGVCIRITFYDNKVKRTQVRQGAVAQILIEGQATATEIEGCHIFGGANGSVVGTTGTNITLTAPGSATVLIGNMFDGTNGSQIYVAPTGGVVDGLVVTGNSFYQINGFPDGTLPAIKLDPGAGSVVRSMVISGNTFSAALGSSAGRYKALVEKTGSGTVEGIQVVGNSGSNLNAIASGFTPTADIGNSYRTSGGTVVASPTGGGGSLSVQDENGTAITGVTQLDFQGAGVNAIAGTGEVVVTIPGGGGGSSNVTTVVKPTVETVNNSTTLQDDDHLFLAVAANSTYTFEWLLHVNATAVEPDIKVAVTVPTGATLRLLVEGLQVSETTSLPLAMRALGYITASGGTVAASGLTSQTTPVKISGSVIVGGTAGDVRLQWAQNTAAVADTQVLAHSNVKAIKV